jgi:hypothetical protein
MPGRRRYLGWVRVASALPAGPGAAGTPAGGPRTTRSYFYGLCTQNDERVASRARFAHALTATTARADAGRVGLCPLNQPQNGPHRRTAGGARRAGWSAVGGRGPRAALGREAMAARAGKGMVRTVWQPDGHRVPVRVCRHEQAAKHPAPRAGVEGCAGTGPTTRHGSRQAPARVSLSSRDPRPAVHPRHAPVVDPRTSRLQTSTIAVGSGHVVRGARRRPRRT